MEIKGRKVVVFGGASGMGRASAELLAGRGADVVVIDRAESGGDEVAKGFGAGFRAADVTDFTGTEAALAGAVDDLGGQLHVTITTAGGGTVQRTLGRDGPHDLDVFRRVLDLNAVASFNVARLSAAHMARNEPEDDERGVIVMTSSIAAFEGQVGQVAYGAAKAAIAGMCLTMARDLGSLGIRVLAIAPSLFDTGALRTVPEEKRRELVAGAAFPKRMGRPQEYAKLAAAIIDNPMLNGQCLRLDAGQRFGPR